MCILHAGSKIEMLKKEKALVSDSESEEEVNIDKKSGTCNIIVEDAIILDYHVFTGDPISVKQQSKVMWTLDLAQYMLMTEKESTDLSNKRKEKRMSNKGM